MTPQEQTILANSIASQAHKGQTRNDGNTPYYSHPLAVEDIAVELLRQYKDLAFQYYPGVDFNTLKEYMRQIAKMHDVVEDTTVTIEDLYMHGFEPIVVEGVGAITKHPVKGAESYLKYLNRVMRHFLARLGKLADLTHNMSDLKPGNMRDKYVLAQEYLRIKEDELQKEETGILDSNGVMIREGDCIRLTYETEENNGLGRQSFKRFIVWKHASWIMDHENIQYGYGCHDHLGQMKLDPTFISCEVVK